MSCHLKQSPGDGGVGSCVGGGAASYPTPEQGASPCDFSPFSCSVNLYLPILSPQSVSLSILQFYEFIMNYFTPRSVQFGQYIL